MVTATALNALDDSVTAVGIVLASELTGPSSSYRGETVLSFNISCVSHFTYKVAAFNSDSKGRFSPVGTHRLTNTLCDAVADPSGVCLCVCVCVCVCVSYNMCVYTHVLFPLAKFVTLPCPHFQFFYSGLRRYAAVLVHSDWSCGGSGHSPTGC